MKLSSIAVNSKAIEHGRWVDAGKLDSRFSGVSFRVRGAGNSDYRKMSDRLRAETPAMSRNDPEFIDRNVVEIILETILVDWKGIENDDGSPLDYSKDTAREILYNPDFRYFRAAVELASAGVGDDDLAEIEDTSKN